MSTSIADLEAAAAALNSTSRGQKAMRDLLAFLDNGGICLDSENRGHVITLLGSAWGDWAGTARDVMREQLEGKK